MRCETLAINRGAIETIDEAVVALLEQRMEAVAAIGRYKKEHHLPVEDPVREEALLNHLKNKVANPSHWRPIEMIYQQIFVLSKKAQEVVLAGYFGEPGSYTHGAAEIFFSRGDVEQEVKTKQYPTFEAVVEGVVKGHCDFGVLPIENSSTGSIHTVYSHSQALSQCQLYLLKKGLRGIPTDSSSLGAKMAASEADAAAIGSLLAAERYGLEILDGPLNDYGENQTRFIIFESSMRGKGWERFSSENTDQRVIGLSFRLPHQSGTLFEILKIFSDRGLNLLKIESRPIGEKPFEYQFYLDFEGALEKESTAEAIRLLTLKTTWLKILGTWEFL